MTRKPLFAPTARARRESGRVEVEDHDRSAIALVPGGDRSPRLQQRDRGMATKTVRVVWAMLRRQRITPAPDVGIEILAQAMMHAR